MHGHHVIPEGRIFEPIKTSPDGQHDRPCSDLAWQEV
jgi:hypothetical protein